MTGADRADRADRADPVALAVALYLDGCDDPDGGYSAHSRWPCRPDLPPGRRVALVGANGAGKSTVAAVLLRFCELSAGAALLNGDDLASFAADDVRSVVGGCPQDPHLFSTTIRDNLRLARPDATDEQLEAAAARARLLPWILSLPRGWETPAGTGGAAVSAGERQRLALARALLADPALLILDEPTAHLDPPARPGAHRRPAARHRGPFGLAHHPRS